MKQHARHHSPQGPRTPARTRPGMGPSGVGNSDIQAMMGGAGQGAEGGCAEQGAEAGASGAGVFGGGVDAMLEAAFGQPVSGLSARFGERRANAELNAEGHTEGRSMSFGFDLCAGMGLDEWEVLAHETAHALAGGGTGKAPVDQPGDAGERGADEAGKRFRAWAAQGFTGPAPQLQPARGGEARIHRYSTDASVLTGSPYLRRGSSGTLVQTLQYLLNELSGAGLSVDGAFGPLTEAAVLRYQRANGLSVDGIVGPQTAGALNSGSSGSSSSSEESSSSGASSSLLTGTPLVKQGDSGPLVETLQRLLNDHGASLSVDGDFGPLTLTAVLSFQRANGLSVDGVVGPQTASMLTSGSAEDLDSGGGSSFAGVEEYDDLRDAVIAAAETHLGAPYYWGADGPSMFDCSGYVLYVLRQDTGLIDWGDDTAHGIMNRLPSISSPEKGDMVFLWSGGRVQHVEIAMGQGSRTIACGGPGAGSSTFGDNPNAKVQYDDWTQDSRSRTFGSIGGIIDDYLKKSA